MIIKSFLNLLLNNGDNIAADLEKKGDISFPIFEEFNKKKESKKVAQKKHFVLENRPKL